MMSQQKQQRYRGREVYARLLRYLAAYWPVFILGILGGALASGTDAAFTWFLKPILDNGFIHRDPVFLSWLPILVIAAFLIRAVASFISSYCIKWTGRNIVMTLRQELFQKFLRLPASHYDESSSGQMLSVVIFNVEQVAKASTTALMTVVREIFFVIGLLVVMVLNSWQLSLIFLITVPLIAVMVKIASSKMRRLSLTIQKSMGQVTHIAEEALEGFKVIRSFGGQDYEQEKFNAATKHNRQREMKVAVVDSLSTSGVQIIAAITIAVTIVLATSSTTFGISAGAFISMIAAMLAILKPLKNLTVVNSVIQKGIAGAQSVFEVLDKPVEIDTGRSTIKNTRGGLSFREVSFVYPRTTRAVLSALSFDVAAGETVALVGRSGSGKSTLVSLIPRFYDHEVGQICLDGIDLKTLTLASLREQIALVSQHITLFNDTIACNIAYGQLSGVSREAIVNAAHAAHAMEFIEEFPEGFDTIVGEDGVLLSGGQRQRIAIARAILKDAPLLILDEATSALDTHSERAIQAALDRLMQHRTTIVIAHRLSTVEKANQIIVLDHGRIIEKGTHESLLAQGGDYARLHALQFRETGLTHA